MAGIEITAYRFAPSGLIPNHPDLPLLHYARAFAGADGASSASDAIKCFATHGWRGAWTNGIYTFHHYHARSHEVLANTGDAVEVLFGGDGGVRVLFAHGDAVVIPAGVGHCRLSDPDRLEIVGAYPVGQEDWDLKRESTAEFALAQEEIPRVALPGTDPILGATGGVLDHWS